MVKPPHATPSCVKAGVSREPIFEGDYSFNTKHKSSLSENDFLVLGIALVISFTIGLVTHWIQRHNKSIHEYALVSQSLRGVVASLSIAATNLSSISSLALPASVYVNNTMEGWMAVPVVLSASIATGVFVPIFYQLHLTSNFEYLELRFSRAVRLVGFLLYIIYSILFSAVVLHSPSIAISSVTGIEAYYITLSMGIVCVTYTTIGSTRGVVYIDIFEYFVMFIGLFIVTVKANTVVGGVSVMLDSGKRTNRILLDNFNVDLSDNDSFWTVLMAHLQLWIYNFGVYQPTLHRCFSCKSLWDAKIAVWVGAFLMVLFIWLSITLALYASAFYENCDPFQADLIENRLEFVPYFVLDTMTGTTGLVGVYISVVMCATLSTFSTSMNTTAVVTLEDLFRIFSKSHIEEKTARRMIQVTTLVFGIFCVEGAVALATYTGDFYQTAMTITGTTSSSGLVVFLMGVLIPKINSKGALSGLFGGILFNLMFLVAKSGLNSPYHEAIKCVSNCNVTLFPHLNPDKMTPTPDPDTKSPSGILAITTRYLGPMSTIFAIIVGVLVSWLTGFQDPQQVEPVLLVSFVDEVFPFYYLPESFRQKCRFGIDHSFKWEKWNIRKEEDISLNPESHTAS